MIPNRTDNAMRIDTLAEKLRDTETPHFWTLFTDEEAQAVGAFVEDALTEEAAFAGSLDNPAL